jgi:hypothetical protein
MEIETELQSIRIMLYVVATMLTILVIESIWVLFHLTRLVISP